MEEPKLIKKGTWADELTFDKKKYYLKVKSGRLLSAVTVMEPGAEFGKSFLHEGEEVHMVVKGIIEYKVGEKSYILEEGDWLWHESNEPHHARNLGEGEARYVTIGSPPTFL
jgi:quercetin dioxygenase-like cupin family protein